MKVGFFIRHFTERGTEVAIWDYAHYNELILGNESIIYCFTEDKQKSMGFPSIRVSFDKFNSRFKLIQINDFTDISGIDVFYTLTGGAHDIYNFNSDTWKNIRTIKHCVFDTHCNESDCYCVISEYLNIRSGTNFPVLPHIISLPDTDDNLRNILNIPKDATVFGGYAAKENFDIPYVHRAIWDIVNKESNIYFLFANFNKFCPDHPNIIHLPVIIPTIEKAKFINTCDAMIWARSGGETFGCAIGEFCNKNKPIICTKTEGRDRAHEYILKDKAIWYTNYDDLYNIFLNFNKDDAKLRDWNAYSEYTPEKVMQIFKTLIQN